MEAVDFEYLATDKSSPVISESDPYICSGCGRKVCDIEHENGYKWSYNCHCNLNELAKSLKRKHEHIKHEKYYRASLKFIPRNFQTVDFDKYVPTTNETAYAAKVCERYAEVFDLYNPRSLILYGDFGTGKSMLSACIMNHIKDKFKVMYIDVNQLLGNISMSWNPNSDLAKQNYPENILKLIRTADLVIFDDIGASHDNKAMLSFLLTAINSRVQKHNIFTTNLSVNELNSNKDWERIFTRMMENTTPLHMIGEDYRRKGKFN